MLEKVVYRVKANDPITRATAAEGALEEARFKALEVAAEYAYLLTDVLKIAQPLSDRISDFYEDGVALARDIEGFRFSASAR